MSGSSPIDRARKSAVESLPISKWSEATFCYLATPLTTISKKNDEVNSTKYAFLPPLYHILSK